MKDFFLRTYALAHSRMSEDSGQSMSEYAMTVAIIAFGCIAGEAAIASSVNQTFIAVATSISGAVLH